MAREGRSSAIWRPPSSTRRVVGDGGEESRRAYAASSEIGSENGGVGGVDMVGAERKRCSESWGE